MPIAQQFMQNLGLALRVRRIAEGAAMLDGAEAELAKVGPKTPEIAALLLLIAQWVDAGYRDHRFLDPLLAGLPSAFRRQLPISDYLRLRMVEAFRALSMSEADSAIEALDHVLKTERDLPDEALAALAHFWKGRAHRKKGEYEASLKDIVRARELAQRSRDDTFTAVIQIQESWLLFQKGMSKDALRLLAHAES